MFLIDIIPKNHEPSDPIVNQSIDNYLLNNLKLPGHGLICYINRPAVIIGSAQNAFSEVDLNYLYHNQVDLVRRTSGGGAVYHDAGNLVFENIISDSLEHCGDYDYFAEPVLTALAEMGLKGGQVSAKSALIANNQKFSGLCMIKGKQGYAAGGTLMFNMNIANARQALTPKKRDQVKRGVLSADRPITNLAPLLPQKYQHMTTAEFKNEFLCHMFHVKHLADIPTYQLTDADWSNIYELVAQKYGRNVWNYGKNPGYEFYSSCQIGSNYLHLNFSVKDDKISTSKIFGNLLTSETAALLEEILVDSDLNKTALTTRLRKSLFGSNVDFVKSVVNMVLEPEDTHHFTF